MLPTFFLIGAPRSGTTSLYRWMRQHPGVFLPIEKEPNFFAIADNPEASEALKARSITDRRRYEALYDAAAPGQARGDASPEYLRSPQAARAIAATVPEARLLAVLRDPVERAWSDFLLHRRNETEPCATFADAIADQDRRQASLDDRAGHYVDSGFYARHLATYRDAFAADQLAVFLFEDLRERPAWLLERAFSHIGVDPGVEIADLRAHNEGGVGDRPVIAAALRARRIVRPLLRRRLVERAKPAWNRLIEGRLDRPPIPPDERAALQELYRDDILALQSILDRDLSHWLRPATPLNP